MAFTDFAFFDHADLQHSHELLDREVLPVLHSAAADTPATGR